MDAKKEKIREFLKTMMAHYKIPGACLSIVHQGEVILQEGYGVTDFKSNTPVNEKTLFGIGSITKSFTAVLLAALLPQHNITWDTPLSKIFSETEPNFHFSDDYLTKHVCLRDLLAHKMGIQLGTSDFSWMCYPFSRDELLSKVQHIPLSSVGFRTKEEYNNIMYSLAGKVIEVLTGSTWEDRIRERFFELLDLSDSSFLNEELGQTPYLAMPHMMVSGRLAEVDMAVHRGCVCIGPAASICSSARDMAKWMQFLLDKGELYGAPIVSARMLEECWNAQFAIPTNSHSSLLHCYISQPQFPVTATLDAYGLGFQKGSYRGYRCIGHSGELFGYDSLMTLYPDMKLGIFTAFNGPGGEYAYLGNMLLRYFITDCILNLSDWLTSQSICEFPEPWVPKSQYFLPHSHIDIMHGVKPVRPLTDYVGTYTHGFLGDVIISANLADDVLTMNHGKLGEFKLHPDGEDDQFRIEGTGAMSFVHQLDLYSPTSWMVVKFSSSVSDTIDELVISFYESSPVFKMSDTIM